jgi:hypothetical protein
MTNESVKKHPFRSVLEEKAPDHLRAIGLIAVEITNLEHALGTLLAAIIDAPEDFGHIIYLTPKTSIARLETLENIIEYLLVGGSDLAKQLQSIIKRTKAIIGKRHRIIHGCWGITDGKVSVYGVPTVGDEKPEAYTVEELQHVVSNIRDLLSEMSEIIQKLRIYHEQVRQDAISKGGMEASRKPSWRSE